MSLMGDDDMYEAMDGDEDEDVDGSVMGFDQVVGRARRRRGGMVRLGRKPAWRNRMVAPGVPKPGQGMEPLPLTGLESVTGTFAAATLAIAFQARPQRPFRPERLLASVVLTGGAVGSVVCDGIFIGTSLQTVELGAFDVSFFAPGAFGVRLSLVPAAPGILIRLPCRFVGAIGAGTAVTNLLFLGRTISG